MALFDDDRQIPKPVHEIGCDLSLMSAAELSERIGMLSAEIDRLNAEKAAKTASRSVAENLFKTK